MYTNIDAKNVSPKQVPLNQGKNSEITPTNENSGRCGWLTTLETSQYEQIWRSAPESCESKIVFPWHKKSQEYSIMNFHPTLVYNRISYQDMSQVMTSLKSEKLYDTEKMIRNQRFWRNVFILLPVLTMITIIVAFAEHINFYLGTDLNIAWFMIPALLLEIVWIIVITKAMATRFQKMLIKRESKITEILERWNENKFEPKGLKLISGVYGAWIELDVEFFEEQRFAPVHYGRQIGEGKQQKILERSYLDSIREAQEEYES